jgi:hypothetical protein
LSQHVIGLNWQLIAEDVTALALVCAHLEHNTAGRLVAELLCAESLPDETDIGLTVASGQAVYGDLLSALGTAGRLYARGCGEACRLMTQP